MSYVLIPSSTSDPCSLCDVIHAGHLVNHYLLQCFMLAIHVTDRYISKPSRRTYDLSWPAFSTNDTIYNGMDLFRFFRGLNLNQPACYGPIFRLTSCHNSTIWNMSFGFDANQVSVIPKGDTCHVLKIQMSYLKDTNVISQGDKCHFQMR